MTNIFFIDLQLFFDIQINYNYERRIEIIFPNFDKKFQYTRKDQRSFFVNTYLHLIMF